MGQFSLTLGIWAVFINLHPALLCRLLVQGYRTPLTEQVMPDLHPREKACNVVPKFLANWAMEMKRARAR